jgi:hypothetical protein
MYAQQVTAGVQVIAAYLLPRARCMLRTGSLMALTVLAALLLPAPGS